MQNIYWEVLYSDSAVYDYVEAYRTGFDLKVYSFADECFEHMTYSLDRLSEFNI